MNNRKKALLKVQMLDFALQEAELYLDTHPGDKEALSYFKEKQKFANEERKNYEKRYGPLTYQSMDNDYYWDWIDEPWPWEGEY